MRMNQKEVEKQKKTILGEAYRQLIPRVGKYAINNFPVLFVGPTGSGKERFARVFMETNKRTGRRMTINCAAYPDTLLRAEVFGYVKGAFTDAKTDRAGLLRSCKDGILFLDELGDASPDFQAAILRVAEGHPFNPIGSDEQVENSNTLFIAATNKPAKIREDLKQRFHILPVPPLQKNDIPMLAQNFLGRPLKEEILRLLMVSDYPGNVRELIQICEKILIEKGKSIFGKKDVSAKVTSPIVFDYSRFEREYYLWDCYVQPVINTYKLNFEYRYYPPPETKISSANIVDAAQNTPKIIADLGAGENVEENLQKFITNLKVFYENRDLSHLLNVIEINFIRPSAMNPRPELTPLLDLFPDEAEKQFKVNYYNFHLKKHSANIQETADALNMKPETLRTRLRRLKKD